MNVGKPTPTATHKKFIIKFLLRTWDDMVFKSANLFSKVPEQLSAPSETKITVTFGVFISPILFNNYNHSRLIC